MPFVVLNIYLEYNVQEISKYRFLFPKTRSNKNVFVQTKIDFCQDHNLKRVMLYIRPWINCYF